MNTSDLLDDAPSTESNLTPAQKAARTKAAKAELENKKQKTEVSADILANFDMSELNDDDGDDPLGAFSDAKIGPMDFVLAKLNMVPNYKRNDFGLKIGGKKAILTRGKWKLIRYRFIILASQTGFLAFESAGGARKKLLANHPIIETRILPAEAQEDIYAFRDSLTEKTGKVIPFAEEEMGA